jgi:hypothetical protein
MHLHLLKVGSQLCVQQLHLCGCGGNALCVPDTLCFLYCLATAAQVSYGCPDATSIPLVCSAQLSSLSLIGALPKKNARWSCFKKNLLRSWTNLTSRGKEKSLFLESKHTVWVHEKTRKIGFVASKEHDFRKYHWKTSYPWNIIERLHRPLEITFRHGGRKCRRFIKTRKATRLCRARPVPYICFFKSRSYNSIC